MSLFKINFLKFISEIFLLSKTSYIEIDHKSSNEDLSRESKKNL